MSQQERRSSITQLLDVKAVGVAAAERVEEIPIADIRPNPDQPRRNFPKESLMDLAASIKSHGLQQPIIVRELAQPAAPGGPDARPAYEIIVGERRLRAHQINGALTIKAIVRKHENNELLRLAIVENIHREDLSLLDRARSFCDFKDRYHNGKVEPAAADLKVSRATGFTLNRIGSADPKYHELISKHDLDVRGSNFLLGLVDRVSKELPDKVDELDKALAGETVGFALLKEQHDRYFPPEKKPEGSPQSSKEQPAEKVKRLPFWTSSDGVLHLELTLKQDIDGPDKSGRRAAAAAATKFFNAAGFKTVKIEP
jgi:ParB family chromosome partitioning protein